MRILAIRGCNLASLAGEFEVDLATGALAGQGVFAIIGPTGSGKSTLLDAMCVALFDRTPRLTNRSTVLVGRDDDPAALGAQDVRTLLRRGASMGWAEVDFESGDARRYRARWSVRRARGATDGRFQNQQVTLTAIDGGQQLGGTKTETLEAIHQRLGLSFDQFRRSALLAQGEFAAFLRADGKDRSELLERMTGTEIYSKLSVAAHVKATLAEQQLRDRQGAAMAIAVLSDEARAQTERELAVATAAQTASRIRLAEAEALARWTTEAERRERALADAAVACASAEDVVAAASAQRAEVVLRRRAELLRAVWDEAARLDRQLAIARGEASTASDAAQRAEDGQRAIAERRTRLERLWQPLREARIAAGLVERRVATVVSDVEQRASSAAAAATWLVERHSLAAPIASWRELDGKLAQQAALAAEVVAVDAALADHAQRRKSLAKQRASETKEHQHAIARLAEAQHEAASFQQKRGLSLDAARRQEDQARLRCSEIDKLAALASEARSAATALAELERQLAGLAAASEGEAAQNSEAERERDQAAVLKVERARVLDELRKAAGYAHARAELVDGDPCPLCGAPEHPWADRGSFDAVIGDAQARLHEAAARGEAAGATLATLAARAQHRATEHSRIAACRITAEATTAASQVRWREQLASLGELLLVDDPSSPAAEQLAHERAETARSKLEAARAARSHAEAGAKAAADAQARVQARQADVEHHVHKLRELDTALASLDAAVERLGGERAGKLERRGELLGQIEGALAAWASDALAASERVAIEQANADLPSLDRCRRCLAELARGWATRCEVVAELDAALAAAVAASDEIARDAERQVAEHGARRETALARRDALIAELAEASGRVEAARIEAGFDIDELRRLLVAEPGAVDRLVEQLEALDRAADRARTLVTERRRLVEDHKAARPEGIVEEMPRLDELAAAVTAADHQAAALTAALAADADARTRRTAALDALAAAERAVEIDRVLGQVIGSHDGKLFRSFAQSLTLDSLLAVANSHLEELAPRYQLERVPKHDLELQVIDRDLGDEVRSVQSLSGGESFLVSLALALGLSSMSAHDVRVRTLLIDEGFGTLDPATLDSALSVLDALQATGRQVGVISHVPALVERVRAHVRVSPRGGGRSDVVVAEA